MSFDYLSLHVEVHLALVFSGGPHALWSAECPSRLRLSAQEALPEDCSKVSCVLQCHSNSLVCLKTQITLRGLGSLTVTRLAGWGHPVQVHLETGTALIVESISRTHDVPFGSSFFVRELVSLQPSSGDADHAAETRTAASSALPSLHPDTWEGVAAEECYRGKSCQTWTAIKSWWSRQCHLQVSGWSRLQPSSELPQLR
eukprot:6092612-Amphidinium_carterae.1